ncbi:MCE family protein [Rhodococcus sp. I2R]|uniref:MCE family protein n=1 Tax=Rhodococcus sp. I2R TaxID=2855445 RepID=UPI0025CFE24D|nr:MlaD family protein [Rhodococcus sp. I2R]MCC8926917.1 MCE family protein [Rhodococcus sp. I2R]
MKLTRTIRIQLWIFCCVAVLATTFTAVQYAQIPQSMGIGRYTIDVELADGAGLYPNANVTYRGRTVGRVVSLAKTDSGARATLSLESSPRISLDTEVEVRSVSAIGEQYVNLLPSTTVGPYLEDGAIVPVERTSLTDEVGPTLDQLEQTLASIDPDRLRTVLDESFDALDGAGGEMRALIDSTSTITESAAHARVPMSTLVDELGPLLQTQVASAGAIAQWSRSMAEFSAQLHASDPQIRSVMERGVPFSLEATELFRDLRPTLPMLLAHLTSVEQALAVYNPSIEQILVLYPPLIAATQSAGLPNSDNPAQNTFFANQLNDPPPCTTGFLPADQRRSPTELDVPPTPPDLYCKVAPENPAAIRGARNLPCVEYPGKRAPTVQLCRDPAGYSPDLQNLLLPPG